MTVDLTCSSDSHKLRAVYYETPKAACSSIKKALQIRPRKENIVRAYHYHKMGGAPQLKTNMLEKLYLKDTMYDQKHRVDFSMSSGVTVGNCEFSMYYGTFEESIEEFKDYYKFGFVREPVKRTVSNFQMFFNQEDSFRFSQMKALFGSAAKTMSFEDFVGKMMKIHNHHWEPYSKYIKDSTQLDKLGKLENIKDDWQEICKVLNIDESLPHENRSKKAKVEVSSEVKEKIIEYYKEDYANFEYESKRC